METAVTGLPLIRVFPDPETLSRAAADMFVSLAMTAISARGRFVVAVSGGSTPRSLYTLLASEPYAASIDWSRVHLFWADERCVPPEHPESNYRLVKETLLDQAPIPTGNIHRMQGETDPDLAAVNYERTIRELFETPDMPVIDLIILGMGDDGHTASLFPHSLLLHETTRLVLPVYLVRPQLDRLTLTLPAINHAAHVLFLVTGSAKAGTVQHILKYGNVREYPAGLVRTVPGELTWFLDQDAAGNEKVTSY